MEKMKYIITKSVARQSLDLCLKEQFKRLKPGIVLDVGAGGSPYKALIPHTEYKTLDIDKRRNPDIYCDIHNITDWVMSKSYRLRRTEKGLFLDIFFEKGAEPVKTHGKIVGLDLGFRKLATLSDGQIVGKDLKKEINRVYKRKKGHLIIKEFINHELKRIDFSGIRTLVVERLRNVKKNLKERNINSFLTKYLECFI